MVEINVREKQEVMGNPDNLANRNIRVIHLDNNLLDL
jgi:hypothetical protein